VRGFLWRDLLLSEGKSAVFGAVTGAVCATAGFYAGRGPAGVGRAAHRGVVLSVMLVLLANYFLNTAVLGVRGGEVPL
jgi:ABC-type transporter Mla maintaining outer membrane lipid asymmetry permease subunit MlaE